MIRPIIIKNNPMILYQFTGSLNNTTEKINTNTKPKVVKGYAYEISNFVMAIIHVTPASSVNIKERTM